MNFIPLDHGFMIFRMKLNVWFDGACKIILRNNPRVFSCSLDHEEIRTNMYKSKNVDGQFCALLEHRTQNIVIKSCHYDVDQPECVKEFSGCISTYESSKLVLFAHEGKMVFTCIYNVSQNRFILIRLLWSHSLIYFLLLFGELHFGCIGIARCFCDSFGCNPPKSFWSRFKFNLMRPRSLLSHIKLCFKHTFSIILSLLGCTRNAKAPRLLFSHL